MTIGQRDRYVTVQQTPAETPGGGFPVEAWTTLGKIWLQRVEQITIRSDESFKADQLSASSYEKWECDYRADMDPDLLDVPKRRRILYLGRIYDITSARQIGRKEAIELVTLAKVS